MQRLASRFESASSREMNYKGRPSTKAIQRNFPYGVTMPVPDNGFGDRLVLMHRWHSSAGVESQQGKGSRQGNRDSVCWCFADAAVADKFQAEFGGERRDFLRPKRML
jgi:hypothetical protein